MSEELFPPTPGGHVDTVRKQRQADQDQLDSINVITEHDNVTYEAVRVRDESPDIGTARTITLSSANPVLQLLPTDRSRRNAVILSVDNDIYLTQDQNIANAVYGAATNGQAFYLSKGLVLTVANQGELYAACTTTATSSRVSVLVSKDS